MNAIALPIFIPFLLILVLLVVRNSRAAEWISVAGSALLLVISAVLFVALKDTGIYTLNMGSWKAPFGITLVLDYFSGLMLVVSSLIVFSLSIYSVYFMEGGHRSNKFYVFFFSLTMGINGAFLTGDAFNLYVWFEVILISSFVLITMGKSEEQLEGGIKYMALNLIGSLFFLGGLGLLYGKTGTLNMAHLAQILRESEQPIFINSSAALFFIAFGIKAAVFPLFFWLPASYHTPNITVTSIFAGLLTKVGVYALIRFFTLFFVQDQAFWLNLFLVIAGLTMVVGGMAASTHYDTRRILSYHIISQIGYMIMGLGIFTPLAIAGAIFFTLHNMIAKTNIFLVSGLINHVKGTFYLKNIGGLYKQNPLLAVLFIIPAFALAGVPPLSGFFAKFSLIKAGIEDGHFFITAVAIGTAMLTLYSMIKIWNEAFLKKSPESEDANVENVKLSFGQVLPSVILGAASILMGLFAAMVFGYTMEAANQLLEPTLYIESVLNGTKP
ncbi:MAG TPA: proton-conducting transporter membrane subunit [Draconibacterium sp.]|nr:proton-conducting transporter membrane subunit [Draconibacterium sp.]